MNYNNLKTNVIGFTRDGNKTLIGKADGKVFSFIDPNETIVKIGKYLDGSHSISDIHEELHNISEGDIIDIINTVFVDNDLIVEDFGKQILDDKSFSKYDRVINYFMTLKGTNYEKAQEYLKKLFASRILIFGAGGTGGHIAHTLVATGVQNITLVDFDRIEISNVTRQMLYTEEDVGKLKVDVAKERLQKIAPESTINTVDEEIKNEKQISNLIDTYKPTFVINAMDTPRGEIRFMIDNVTYDQGIPLILNGSSSAIATAGPLILKGQTSSYNDMFKPDPVDEIVKEANDSVYLSNVIEPLNGTAAHMTSYEVIKYITGCGPVVTFGTELKLNLQTMELKKDDFEKL